MAKTACAGKSKPIMPIVNPREIQIRELLDAGKTRAEISAITGLSRKSVDYYVDKIRRRGFRKRFSRDAKPKSRGLAEMERCVPVGLDPRTMAAPKRPVVTRRDVTDPGTPPMLLVRIPYPGGIMLDRRKEVCPWLASE